MTACPFCGVEHNCDPEVVSTYLHALRDIAAMAKRSDAHPDLDMGAVAEKALSRSMQIIFLERQGVSEREDA